MVRAGTLSTVAVLIALSIGCAVPGQRFEEAAFTGPTAAARTLPADAGDVRTISFVKPSETAPPTPPTQPVTLDDFVTAAVARNPRLAKAAAAVDAARGRFVQAGLYPNPVLSFTADELGDRTGPNGILTPAVSQEIVRGGKLQLSQAVAAAEVDQAALALMGERYAVLGAVRAAYYEAFALQERAAVLRDLVRLTETIAERTAAAREAGGAAEIDVLQLELERERVRAEAKAVERELPAALRRLAAVAGVGGAPGQPLAAPFDPTALDYDLDRTRDVVLAVHPAVRSARVAVDRAQRAVHRAEVEPVPNVTVTGGYTRQNQNRSNDWTVGVSVPLPVWNRNQGNVLAARAELAAAHQDVGRAEFELAERVAVAFRKYAAARQRAEWYRDHVVKRAERAIAVLTDETLKPRANVTVLQVVQAQRTLAEARLEVNKSLGEAWAAAAELSGLLLEETWPPRP